VEGSEGALGREVVEVVHDILGATTAQATFDVQVAGFMATLAANPFTDRVVCTPSGHPSCYDECNTIRDYINLLFKAADACGIVNPVNPDNWELPSGPSCHMNCAFTSLCFTESCAPFVAAISMPGTPQMTEIAASSAVVGVAAVRDMTIMLQGQCWIEMQQLTSIAGASPPVSCMEGLLRSERKSCGIRGHA
jgi:hypothetical protein